jgi:phosphatidate cytidylyltransferase
MAFNKQVFQKRAATAVLFVAVMAVGLLWNQWSFFVLFSVVHFGCWMEYQKLVSLFNPHYKNRPPVHTYGVMLAGWCGMLYFTNNELAIAGVRLSDIGFWLGLVLLLAVPVAEMLQPRYGFLKNMGYSLCGLLYISLSLGLLLSMRYRWSEAAYRLNLTIPLLVIFTLWINDTMAYLVGSAIGKTPLSPISPKKTWEGTIGGILLAIIVLSAVAYVTGRLPVVHTAIITTLAAISGTFGDLFESKLKRLAGVKDSGRIMPGHGGFLDRFDSLLFASTVVWFYAMFFIG